NSISRNANNILYYRDLIEVIFQKGFMQCITSIGCRTFLYEFIQATYSNISNCSSSYKELLEKEILKFSLTTSRKWSKVNRNYKKFTKTNTEWLNTKFKMPSNKKSNFSIPDRPVIPFALCSKRTQRQKIKIAISNSNMNSPEILCAAKNKMVLSGQRTAAHLFEETQASPSRAKKMKTKYNYSNYPIPYTADEALAFIIDNKLKKQQYINIRLGSKKRNCNIYPTYENIIIAKTNCYPNNMDIGESSCKIPLQDLLDHTTNRIFQVPEVCKISLNSTKLEMLYKWGCDGSSGQSQYRQNFNDDSLITDETMFMFSIVPLELRSHSEVNDVENNYEVIWTNPSPSSTKFCRPIKYIFKKETIESTKEEVKDIETQILKLVNTDVIFNESIVHVKHTLIFSMVDGKVCNSMTGTSSQTCYI
ncbi:hypothetical protein AGLY_017280, partial [Aphis glycines]